MAGVPGAFPRPLCTARPFEAYRDRFDLTDADLARGPVLDCPSGGSGLVLELARRGTPVVGVDPVFGAGREGAAARLRADGDECLANAYQDYAGPDAPPMRLALDGFVAALGDPGAGADLVAAVLPDLPFPDRTFALVLSGHLLFTYGHLLTPADHVACLRELVRVAAGPVRVFPVATGEASAHDPNGAYPHLDAVLGQLADDGCRPSLRTPPSTTARRLGWQLLELVPPGLP